MSAEIATFVRKYIWIIWKRLQVSVKVLSYLVSSDVSEAERSWAMVRPMYEGESNQRRQSQNKLHSKCEEVSNRFGAVI